MCEFRYRLLLIVATCLMATLRIAAVMDKVDITLPTTITFPVTDVRAATTGIPAPTLITFEKGNLHDNMHLQISVKANAAVGTPPGGGPAIPAGSFSWTVANATGGSGFNGTLSYSDFTVVYQSIPWQHTALTGTINLNWKMAPPPTGAYAGTHTLSITWKVESIQ